MAAIGRTFLKSPPEVWELIDDPALMQRWIGTLIDQPVEAVTVVERDEERRLSFAPPDGEGFRSARIDVSFTETAFGTRVDVESEFQATGWKPSARRAAEEAAEARMDHLLDAAIEEMATPQKRPFSAAP